MAGLEFFFTYFFPSPIAMDWFWIAFSSMTLVYAMIWKDPSSIAVPEKAVKRTVWCQSRLQEIPPEQITSYSMSPMHRSPFIAVRMILKKQMAFIIEKRKTIRVVYPSTGRCQMESRSFWFFKFWSFHYTKTFFLLFVCSFNWIIHGRIINHHQKNDNFCHRTFIY